LHIVSSVLFLWISISGKSIYAQTIDSTALRNDYEIAVYLIDNNNLDSAQSLLENIVSNSFSASYWDLYAKAKIKLANIFEQLGEPEAAVKHYIELIVELEKNEQSALLAETYYNLGSDYMKYDLNNKASTYFLLALKNYHEVNDTKKEVATQIVLGNLYYKTKKFDLALTQIEKATNLINENNLENDIVPLLKTMVLIYEETGDFEKMLEKNLLILEINKSKNNLSAIAESLSEIGYNYSELGDYSLALKHFYESYHTRNLLGTPDSIKGITLYFIGITLNNLGDRNAAIDTLNRVWKFYASKNDYKKVAVTLNSIAKIHADEKNFNMAISTSKKSIKNAEKSNDLTILKESNYTLFEIYQEMDNFKNALDTYKIYLALDDSINRLKIKKDIEMSQREINIEVREKKLFLIVKDEEVKDMALLQMQLKADKQKSDYELLKADQERNRLEKERAIQNLKILEQSMEAEKKDREIQTLQRTKEIQQYELKTREAQEKEQKNTILLQEQELEKITLRRKLFGWILGLLVLIMILIVIGYFQKRKANNKLHKQKDAILKINEELEVKNSEIERQRNKIEESLNDLQKTLDSLKKTQGQLIESEKMASLGHLTAGIAHEINNPINFVSSNVQPLKMSISEIINILNTYRKANSGDDKIQYLEEARNLEDKYDLEYLLNEVEMLLNGIFEGAERTKEIVLGLRNFSRVDKYELKKINLKESINSTLLLLRNKYKDRIKIEKEFDTNLNEIECYPGQLNQVLLNILNNAIQAISDKGTISIKTKKVKNQVNIEISDDGKGIPEEFINNIFDPFYTTKDVGEGTGLGLSISYGIIQQHQGEISVKSEVGSGTTFTITIPIEHSTK